MTANPETLTLEELDGLEMLCERRHEWDSTDVYEAGEAMPALLQLARRALVTEPVIADCLAYLNESDLCLFCTRHPEKLVNWHADDCPLVVAQLITRSGARTEGDR